ncbi:Ets domain [Trinorchestia longiramus]|nr:Ets domain [Trinorchestia longiramus]
MMAPLLDLVQPHHDAAKHDGYMFPDMLHCHEFLQETEIKNSYFNRAKAIDNPEQFQSSSDQVFFDLSMSDIEFSDLLLVPGVNTHEESGTKSPPITPRICQNLSEDIFKTYSCLADAMSPSFEKEHRNTALSSSCDIQQIPHTMTELDALIGNNDVLHDRFKTRSLSIDSAFANYQEETEKFFDSNLHTTSAYSEYTEMRPLEAASVMNLDTMHNSESQFHKQLSYDENSTTICPNILPGNKFDHNELNTCSRLTEDTSTKDTFTDSICQLQFRSEPNQSVYEDKGTPKEPPQSMNECTDNSVEGITPNCRATDFTEDLCSPGVKSSPEFLLPATLDLVSCETSAEVSLESLPESLLHLDDAPKNTCDTRKPSSRRKRGRKLWEFLLDLLEDPMCNPSLIRWEDKARGVFRLKEQEIIARKWGKRREKKDNLSYDYFARALRYHYKSKMLVSVPERKLVYKFGPKVVSEMK